MEKRSDCPFSSSLDIFGDKWSLLIIRDLMFFDKNTYGDFLKSKEGIATNILASRLQALADNGLILKLEHPTSKAKNLYRLTDKGIDLLPMMVEMYLWADKYFIIPEELKTRISTNKEEFIHSHQLYLKKTIYS